MLVVCFDSEESFLWSGAGEHGGSPVCVGTGAAWMLHTHGVTIGLWYSVSCAGYTIISTTYVSAIH